MTPGRAPLWPAAAALGALSLAIALMGPYAAPAPRRITDDRRMRPPVARAAFSSDRGMHHARWPTVWGDGREVAFTAAQAVPMNQLVFATVVDERTGRAGGRDIVALCRSAVDHGQMATRVASIASAASASIAWPRSASV